MLSCKTNAPPEVLEAMGFAANIREDDTITPDGDKPIVRQSESPRLLAL